LEKHLSFWGGIDTQQILPYGTPDESAGTPAM